MQILTVDVGTGTQDILLFDQTRAPENWLKLVMPSPTVLLGEQIKQATALQAPLLITGVIMGGGPCAWAADAHLRAGLPIYATPEAARTFNDDLEQVRLEMGVEIVDEGEADRLARRNGIAHIAFRDFDYPAVRAAFAAFGVRLEPDALALAVFDHGAAPPGVSDRQFRMDYLAGRLQEDRRLSTFAAPAGAVPEIMTRLAALAETAAAQSGRPVVVMDTAPAAILGALEDPVVAGHADALIVNVGNFHTLAFQFRGGEFARLFEHHTGFLDGATLTRWLALLAGSEITHAAVFGDHGHGALVLDATPAPLDFVAVVGPRRTMLRATGLPAYFAVPHGDQMLAGCFGLLRACADVMPAWQDAITSALAAGGDRSLW